MVFYQKSGEYLLSDIRKIRILNFLQAEKYGGYEMKIRTRPANAIKDCGRVPRNLVVFLTIKKFKIFKKIFSNWEKFAESVCYTALERRGGYER